MEATAKHGAFRTAEPSKRRTPRPAREQKVKRRQSRDTHAISIMTARGSATQRASYLSEPSGTLRALEGQKGAAKYPCAKEAIRVVYASPGGRALSLNADVSTP